jgi:hypothetical protein
MVFIRAQEEVISKNLYIYIYIYLYSFIHISFLQLCVLESLMIFFSFFSNFFEFALEKPQLNFFSTNGSLLGAQGFKYFSG